LGIGRYLYHHGFYYTLRGQELRKQGKTDREARLDVSHKLGHNRIDVVKGYIPM